MNMQEMIGDYRGFFKLQRDRLTQLGIDIAGLPISHLAYRTATMDEYRDLRGAIEEHCVANVENVWNGRPISKLRLNEPLDLAENFSTHLIELIPPIHPDKCKMGLEHVGVVMADAIDQFHADHKDKLTGQQLQSAACEPYFISFEEDQTMIKFYRHSLQKVCEIEGHVFDGFYHADGA